MPVFFKTDKFVLLLLTAVFCCLLPFFYMHQGILSIDTGREFYIAEQLLHGNVLYKDIFNIYGALPYMLNSFLFLIFGAKLKTLYVAGIIVSWFIVALVYLISREFLNKKLSFLIGLTTITSLVFGVFQYNSIIPYTYTITYATVGFLASVFSLIKYVKSGNKISAYAACIFAGFSFACKYEYIPYIAVLIYVFGTLDKKTSIRCLCYAAFMPALFFGILLLQGLNLSDIKTTVTLLDKTVHAPSITVFYKNFGVYPSLKGIIKLIFQNGIFAIFAFLPIINIMLFIKDIKSIIKDKALFVFLLCAFSACAKNFFYLNVNHYGIYIFPICLIASVILLKKYSKKILPLVPAIIAILFSFYNFDMLQNKTYKLTTDKGSIYTFEKDGKPIQTAVDYLKNNSNENDTVLVLPEGAIINFLSGRKTMNMYHSLIPLYYDDVFGEEKVVTDVSQNMPEFIIILKHSQIEYGKGIFGKDYGRGLFDFIGKNYEIKYDDDLMTIYSKF